MKIIFVLFVFSYRWILSNCCLLRHSWVKIILYCRNYLIWSKREQIFEYFWECIGSWEGIKTSENAHVLAIDTSGHTMCMWELRTTACRDFKSPRRLIEAASSGFCVSRRFSFIRSLAHIVFITMRRYRSNLLPWYRIIKRQSVASADTSS